MGEDTDPPPLYKARAFGSHDNAPPPLPCDKKPSYGPAYFAYRKPATSQFLDDQKVISYNSLCSSKGLIGLRYLGFVEKSIRGKLIQPKQTNLGCTTPPDMENRTISYSWIAASLSRDNEHIAWGASAYKSLLSSPGV